MTDVIAMFILADVVAQVEADVIASKFIYLWQMENHCGRCYNHLLGGRQMLRPKW